jgi:hypothetical protein
MGWLYTRLVASNSFAPEYHVGENGEDENEREHVNSNGATSSQRTRLNNSVKEFMAMFVF